MASVEQVQAMIVEALMLQEDRIKREVADFVQAEIKVQTDNLGKLFTGAQTALAQIEEKTGLIIKHTADADARTSAIVIAVGQANSKQQELTTSTEDLQSRVAVTLNGIVEKFSVDQALSSRRALRPWKIITSYREMFMLGR